MLLLPLGCSLGCWGLPAAAAFLLSIPTQCGQGLLSELFQGFLLETFEVFQDVLANELTDTRQGSKILFSVISLVIEIKAIFLTLFLMNQSKALSPLLSSCSDAPGTIVSSRQDKIEYLAGRNEHTRAGSLFMCHYPVRARPAALPGAGCPARGSRLSQALLGGLDPIAMLASPDLSSLPRTCLSSTAASLRC